MAADLSRIRHNPLLDYSAVLLQQGRVLLDADFNELAEVVDRRLRAMASDVLGRATVSSTTPDAFRISLQGGTLQIGKGRLYVDGLLAECHGGPADDAAQKRFDPLLAETTFPDPLTYASQPWLAAPPALPTTGTHLVYLDVWEREVTVVEDPSLQEIALGVDTTACRQLVWQVRVLAEGAGGASCASADEDVPGWGALIAPSVARLSTGSFEAPGSDDPCELPPSGGYRGLENQSYRVEVHDAGLPGAGGATFKWSRDNASVASRVASIVSSTRLELASLGRDEVLRFNTGDWVEITDDLREQAQQAGEMRRITVDEAARAISFSPPLPAGMLPAAFPDDTLAQARNLRVRRWDHSHQVLRVNANGSTSLHHDLDADDGGVIPVPPAGTTLLLERGVTVQFGVGEGEGRFRAGDHWVFAARTADASVELLENAPPRGIHHHYARLGFWNVGAGTVSDCRHPWPPAGGQGHDCSCTVCVTPESHASGALTVQAAVDEVRQRGGGTVCLALGQYVLDRPVQLDGVRSTRVRGEGAGTVLVAVEGGAFQLTGAMAVALEDMALLGTAEGDLVHAHNTLGLSLQRLVLAQLGESNASAALGLSGVVLSAALHDSVVLAPHGVAAGTLGTVTGAGRVRTGFLMSGALRIEDNLFACRQRGIDLSGMVLHVLTNRIAGNDITSCRQDGVRLTGLAAPGAAMRVCDNLLSVRGGHGITAGVDGLWIEGNRLRATRASGSQTPTGVGIRIEAGLDAGGPDECQVLANQLRGFESGGVLIGRAGDLIVKLNIIVACGYGIWLQDESDSARVSIENNHLSDIGNRGGGLVSTVGIAVARAQSAALSGNTISGVGRQADEARMVVGIFATSVEQLRLSHNSVTDIGPPGNFDRGYSVGLMLRMPFGEADISHNQVDRDGVPLAQRTGRFTALWIDEEGAGAAAGVLRATAGSTTLVFGNRRVYTRSRFTAAAGALPSNAGVRGNSFGARGLLPAVRVVLDGDCHFSDNRCEWRGGGPVAVQLVAGSTVLSGNRVRGGETSIQVRGNTKAVTVLGNITTGPIDIDGPLGAWAPLNVLG